MPNASNYNWTALGYNDEVFQPSDGLSILMPTLGGLESQKLENASDVLSEKIKITGDMLENIWLNTWIKSRNYKPGSQGFMIDGIAGKIYIAELDLVKLYAKTAYIEKRLLSNLPVDQNYCGNATDMFASGYSSSVGNLVFMGNNGKWLLCDSDAIATSGGMLGIAMEAKNDTQAMRVALPGSFIRDDTWTWTVGDTLYAGETPGTIQATIPTGVDGIVKVIGWAVSASIIYFNPSSDNLSITA